MRNATFDKPARLTFLNVGSNLDARGATLSGLDLRGTRIEGELRLGLGEGAKKTEWMGSSPKITLRNASVGALEDTEDSWPDNLEREFEGFIYQRLGGLGMNEKEDALSAKQRMVCRLACERQDLFTATLSTLGEVFSAPAGHEEKADDILYANRARKHRESDMSWRRWAFLWMLWIVIGYGYGWLKFLALIWVGVLVILGTFILRIAGERDKILSGFLNSAFYSLDMLLPVIRLRERHYKDVDLSTWARYYFYFHQIMGYVLIFFVIAGLSGLTK